MFDMPDGMRSAHRKYKGLYNGRRCVVDERSEAGKQGKTSTSYTLQVLSCFF